ncbi:MAG: FkbM family methyltransferase [Phycisphaerae bacterium]
MLRGYGRIAPTQRGGYRLARTARGLLPRSQWAGTFAPRPGMRLNLDLGTYPDCCMAVGLFELDTERLLRKLLRPGGHFVDGGANLGYFTLLAAGLVGGGTGGGTGGGAGRVDAFEPDPLNRAALEAHISLNGVGGQVHVHPLALGEKPERLTLHHPAGDGQNHGQASLLAELAPGGQRFEVEVVRADAVITRTPDVVKLDVEGAELPAIRGMAAWLAGESPPAMVIEHNPVTARAAGHTPGDVWRVIKEIQPRYELYWIGRRLVHLPSAEAVDALLREGNLLARVPAAQ